MFKLGDLALKFLKTNVRFEISTFEIGYSQNLIKIRKLRLFGTNAFNLVSKLLKPISDLKSTPSNGLREISTTTVHAKFH